MRRVELANAVELLGLLALGVLSLSACSRQAARIAAAESAKRAILDELADGELPEWAGEYVCGGGLTHEQMLVAPRTGFVYVGRGCESKDALIGKVVLDEDILRLAATIPTDFYTGMPFPDSLVPVRKGSKRILLRGAKKVIEACNESSSGWIRYNTFVHVDDVGADWTGPLVVPASFRKYQLATPIVGRVTLAERVEDHDSAGESGFRSHVHLSVGDDTRALAGMTFYVPIVESEAGSQWSVFTVDSAEPGADLELSAWQPKTEPLPVVGAHASTSAK